MGDQRGMIGCISSCPSFCAQPSGFGLHRRFGRHYDSIESGKETPQEVQLLSIALLQWSFQSYSFGLASLFFVNFSLQYISVIICFWSISKLQEEDRKPRSG